MEERRNSYYSCTLPGGALELGEVCAPHLRHRLAAPGRLTAMCHDRRTNAGNLQFSFALIDHTVAGKAFHVKLSKIAFQTGGEGSYFYLLPVIPFSTLAHHLRFISRTRVIIRRYPRLSYDLKIHSLSSFDRFRNSIKSINLKNFIIGRLRKSLKRIEKDG